MRFHDIPLCVPRTLEAAKKLFFSLTLMVFVAVVPTFALQGDMAPAKDEVKKLIKQAAKLASAEDLNEAETLLRKALSLDPKRDSTKVELGFVLTKQRRLLEAYNIVFPVAEKDPKNARAYAVLGNILLAAGKFEEARVVFYTSLKTDRSQDLAWAGFGMLNFYENRIEESLIKLREAVGYFEGEPDYWFAIAQVSARAEKYSDAADAYRSFLHVSSNTDSDRRERIKGMIKFLFYLGQRDSLYNSSGKDQTSVQFELVDDRPIVKVRVNDNKEWSRFVLDTGSGITVISDRTAAEMRINPVTRGGFAKGLGGDGRFEIVYGFLQQLTIGDVAVKNIPIYIRKFHNDQQRYDGYIGLALISKFLTTLDYGKNTLHLTRNESARKEFAENASPSLPLRLTSSGFLSGEVKLGGYDSPLNFIVDTGAGISVISDRLANTDNISSFAMNETLDLIGSAGVTADVPKYMLPEVKFGDYSQSQIAAIALNLDVISDMSGFEQGGILGGNFLKNYRLTFDFKNSRLAIIPNGSTIE